MPTVNISPNMMLPCPVPTQDLGPDWAFQVYNCLYSVVDQHDHSNGKGVQIQPDGLNITANVPFQGNSVTGLLTTSYNTQPAPLSITAFPYALYVSGGNLYYNSISSQIQITTPSNVNVTSSGISSPPASASFVSGVLVVNENTNTPGNIQLGSLLLGNNSVGTNFVTIEPAAATTGYTITLPLALPGATSFVTETAAGQLGYVSTVGGITGSNIAAATITGANMAANLVLSGSLSVDSGFFPNRTGSSVSLQAPATSGEALVEDFGVAATVRQLPIVVSSPVANGNPLMVIRGFISSTGAITSGEGFSVTHPSTGVYDITFTNALADTPAFVVTSVTTLSIPVVLVLNATTVQVVMNNTSNTPVNSAFTFVCVGAFYNF